ncbi:MAG: hypothetical protein QM725_12080 [Lacibacter sp.]
MTKQVFHICNEETPQINGGVNIYSISAIPETIDNAQSIFLVNVHLNWQGRHLSKNYGFEVANELRTKLKSKAPIVFYSPLQKEYFEQQSGKEIKYKILFGRGSAFLEAPFKETNFKKLAEDIEPLSNAALHDVATMLCDLKGIVIDKLNHDLKFVEKDKIDEAIGSVTPYLSEYQKGKIKLDEFTANIKAAKIQDDFNALKLQFITLCNQELTEKGKEIPQERKKKHKILVLDDLREEINKAKENLKAQFAIEEAATGKEAIDILKKDVKNDIVAVIADWRLFNDAKQTYWQPLQGYEVLDFAAKNGIRSLFALTSQADFVVHHLRNLMGIRFSMFKKENLNTPDQWKVFADVLFEACEEAFKLRCSIPTSVNWTNNENKGRNATYISLQQQYIEKWNSDERDTYWNSIDEKSNEIWNWLEIESKNNYKSLYTLKMKYDMSLSSDRPELFPVLVFRRIWMALWYSKNDSNVISKEGITAMKEFCFEIMFTGTNKEYNSSAPGTEMNKLCLKANEICAKKMLPEEREWLVKQKLIEII